MFVIFDKMVYFSETIISEHFTNVYFARGVYSNNIATFVFKTPIEKLYFTYVKSIQNPLKSGFLQIDVTPPPPFPPNIS